MEDRRAHERLDVVEAAITKHNEEHRQFEASIAENTKLTQTIVDNTTELVQLVKGAKGLRSFVIWAAPLAGVMGVVYTWIKGH